jgi:hypothetical protein
MVTGIQCREPAIPAPELEAQISRALQEVTIPERVLSWLLERVTRVLHAEEDRRRQVRETLEKTLGEVRRESETLLSLRLRDLITDDVFVARKADLDTRMRDFEARLAASPKSPDEVVRLTADVFRFASRAAQVFQAGSGVQKRMILEAVGSNYTLKGREMYPLGDPIPRPV